MIPGARRVTKSILSAWGLLVLAAILALPFAACHLTGMRETTGVLCGTYSPPRLPFALPLPEGLLYAVSYLVFVFVAPIPLLGAGMLLVLEQVTDQNE